VRNQSVEKSGPVRFVSSAISFYQRYVSPLKKPSCRFYPSCSEYTKQAVEQHGFIRGIAMGARRLLRCHPFNPGGYDPVK
jgi:putative membrane protein insertion efficiency factor